MSKKKTTIAVSWEIRELTGAMANLANMTIEDVILKSLEQYVKSREIRVRMTPEGHATLYKPLEAAKREFRDRSHYRTRRGAHMAKINEKRRHATAYASNRKAQEIARKEAPDKYNDPINDPINRRKIGMDYSKHQAIWNGASWSERKRLSMIRFPEEYY